MDLDFVWNLPASYGNPKIASRLSADAQVYLRCVHCAEEARIDVSFALQDDFDDAKCSACAKSGMEPIRHLEKRIYRCRDCQHSFTSFTALFMADRCPSCASNQLTVLSSIVEPPFPARFDELLVAKNNKWGVSAREDCEYIVRSSQALNFLPDFPLHLLTDILFSERLRTSGGYTNTDDLANLLVLEGNLYRDYFRRTGEVSAGLRAIPIFEQCVLEQSDPANRALMEHNVAMAVYSLLSRYDEDIVEVISARKDIRKAGIEAANRALAVFTPGSQVSTLSQDSIRTQCARIHYLIGDLLKVGKASESERRRAIEHFNGALTLNALDPRLTAGVLESRATTILRLENPSADLTEQAIRDMEFVVSREEEGRAWSDKMDTLGNLAALYQRRENLTKAIE